MSCSITFSAWAKSLPMRSASRAISAASSSVRRRAASATVRSSTVRRTSRICCTRDLVGMDDMVEKQGEGAGIDRRHPGATAVADVDQPESRHGAERFAHDRPGNAELQRKRVLARAARLPARARSTGCAHEAHSMTRSTRPPAQAPGLVDAVPAAVIRVWLDPSRQVVHTLYEWSGGMESSSTDVRLRGRSVAWSPSLCLDCRGRRR